MSLKLRLRKTAPREGGRPAGTPTTDTESDGSMVGESLALATSSGGCSLGARRERFERLVSEPARTELCGEARSRSQRALSHGSENSVTVPSSLESSAASSRSASSRSPAEPDSRLSYADTLCFDSECTAAVLRLSVEPGGTGERDGGDKLADGYSADKTS